MRLMPSIVTGCVLTTGGLKSALQRFSCPAGWWMIAVDDGTLVRRSQPMKYAFALAGIAVLSSVIVASVPTYVASSVAPPVCAVGRGSTCPLAALPGARQVGLS